MIAHHGAILELTSLDFEVVLSVEQHDRVGHVPLLRHGQIQIIVSLRVPEVKVHCLSHVGLNARHQSLHLPVKVLDDLESVMSIADFGQDELDDPLELLLLLERV